MNLKELFFTMNTTSFTLFLMKYRLIMYISLISSVLYILISTGPDKYEFEIREGKKVMVLLNTNKVTFTINDKSIEYGDLKDKVIAVNALNFPFKLIDTNTNGVLISLKTESKCNYYFFVYLLKDTFRSNKISKICKADQFEINDSTLIKAIYKGNVVYSGSPIQ